jgi:putative ABC transport system substrate-binding protein
MKWRLALFLIAVLLSGGATSFAFAQHATPPAKVSIVLSTTSQAASLRVAAFHRGLQELGYVDGRNILVSRHSWAGDTRPLPEMAADLVKLNPAVIVAEGNPALFALRQATQTVPIVMAIVADPVGAGFVATLPRPGGNITGLSNTAEVLSGKRLELLKELAPGLRRAAALHNPTNRTHTTFLRETEAAAATLGVVLVPLEFKSENDLEGAFRAMSRDRVQGVIVFPQPAAVLHSGAISSLASRSRMPTIFHTPEGPEAGGLASYGPSPADLWLRTAGYVDRILKGARPSDLPVEQPTRFDLVLNLRAARELQVTIAPALLLRATRTIE